MGDASKVALQGTLKKQMSRVLGKRRTCAGGSLCSVQHFNKNCPGSSGDDETGGNDMTTRKSSIVEQPLPKTPQSHSTTVDTAEYYLEKKQGRINRKIGKVLEYQGGRQEK